MPRRTGEARTAVHRRNVAARPTVIGLVALLVGVLATASCSAGGDATTGAAGAAGARPPSSQAEFKITVAGDSISVGFGANLRDAVEAPVVVKVIGEDGTGLARPDRFDWPARLQKLAAEFPPDVLVLSVGSNDAQDLRDAAGNVVVPFTDEAAWDAEYTRRLRAAIEPFTATGTRVVWLGHVRTTEDRVGLTNRRIHRLAAAMATDPARPGSTPTAGPPTLVADLGELLGTGEAVASRCLLPDGVHLTTECLKEAAAGLLPRIAPA